MTKLVRRPWTGHRVGARPGEKLEEFLWEEDGVVGQTLHPHILKVTEHDAKVEDLNAVIDSLDQAAKGGDRLRVEAILRRCVPTFTSSPSGGRVSRAVPLVKGPLADTSGEALDDLSARRIR